MYKSFPRVIILVLPILIGFSADSLAQRQGGWNTYISKTGLYTIDMPGNPDIMTETMRSSPEYTVHSEEMIATIDQRAYKNSLKTYSVSVKQTWGPGFNNKQRWKQLNQELAVYMKSFEDGNVKVKKAEIPEDKDYLEYYVTFEDPKLGTQGIRTRVHYTNTARIEQTISGPNKIMTDSKTARFMDSLTLKRGYTKDEGRFDESWERYQSTHDMFTFPYPHEKNIYFPYAPNIKKDNKSETIHTIFYDPIKDQNIYYNVYGYKFSRSVSEVMAKQVMAKHHIRRYNPRAKNISFTALMRDGKPTLQNETLLQAPPKKAPYVNTVRLRAQYFGNVLVVQEILGNHTLTRSNFAGYLMNLLKFTPERSIKADLSGSAATINSNSTQTE